MMTLKEVCNLVGVTRRAVQGYEDAGLVVSSGKNKYGHLLYDGETVEKIRYIKQYQEFGFTVNEIKTLMTASEDMYVDMLSDRVERMKAQLKSLVTNIKVAEKMIAEKQR